MFVITSSTTRRAIIHYESVVIVVRRGNNRHEDVRARSLLFEGVHHGLQVRNISSLCRRSVIELRLRLLSALRALTQERVMFQRFRLLAARRHVGLLIRRVRIRNVSTLGVGVAVFVLQYLVPVRRMVVRQGLRELRSICNGLSTRALTKDDLTQEEQAHRRRRLRPFTTNGLLNGLHRLLLLRHFTSVSSVHDVSHVSDLIRIARNSSARSFLPTVVLLRSVGRLILPNRFTRLVQITSQEGTRRRAVVMLLRPRRVRLKNVNRRNTVVVVRVFACFVVNNVSKAQDPRGLRLLRVTLFLRRNSDLLNERHRTTCQRLKISSLLRTTTRSIRVLVCCQAPRASVRVRSIKCQGVSSRVHVQVGVLRHLTRCGRGHPNVNAQAQHEIRVRRFCVLKIVGAMVRTFRLIVCPHERQSVNRFGIG